MNLKPDYFTGLLNTIGLFCLVMGMLRLLSYFSSDITSSSPAIYVVWVIAVLIPALSLYLLNNISGSE